MLKFQAAAYLRLSYTENRENESDSIANQKKLIEDYVKGRPDIELVSEKVDDGYSGILFDRPAFQEMMQDITEGRVNCVIVKDLSRLGREYIETGRYLRRIFPAYGVRFIAINDNIDTAHEHAGDDLSISMKNIINDAYCHDISVKTRSALAVKRRNGDYVGACPVYGYRKSEENRNRLVVDEYAARVVRDIFRARIDGRSAKKIADELNALGVLSPLAYKVNRGLPHPTGGFADRKDAKWSATTVIRILQDEIYTGTLVQGRRGTVNHKIKDVVKRPAEEWVRVENAHEPIIRKTDFNLVQSIMKLDTRTTSYGDMNKQAQIILNLDNLSSAEPMDIDLAQRAEYQKQIAGCQDQKRILYERLLLQEIGTEDYKALKAEVDTELARLNQVYSALCARTEQMQMACGARTIQKQAAQEVASTDGLTARLVETLIDRIYVRPKNQVEIVWKIKDFCLEG